MAVDGNWNLTMSTPMGERKATLTLLNTGGTLTGVQGADGNSTEIFDGAISGDSVNWKVSITNPMPLTLEFIGKVSGDSMTGDMKLWTFYVTVVLIGAKVAAFAIQYIAFRILVGNRIRAAAQRA